VEEERSVAEVVAKGHDRATVERVQQMLYTAEYKRRQAAPGVKITRRNFGRDRRYPITNGFRDVS
jgi:NAD+ synthase